MLVPVKDVNSLAEAMKYMIDHPEEIQRMAKKGRSKAEAVFDVKKVNEKICRTMQI